MLPTWGQIAAMLRRAVCSGRHDSGYPWLLQYSLRLCVPPSLRATYNSTVCAACGSLLRPFCASNPKQSLHNRKCWQAAQSVQPCAVTMTRATSLCALIACVGVAACMGAAARGDSDPVLDQCFVRKTHPNQGWKMLRILEIVDEFLGQQDIPYVLAYGTMLGAVRQQGFMPW